MARPKPDLLPFTELKFINYLSKGRTIRSIGYHFKISEKETRRLLKQNYKGYDLFEPLNEYNEVLYSLVKQPPKEIVLQPRKIATRYADGTEDYIQVQMRGNHQEIRIVPLCDAHYGNKCHKREKFLKYIEYIRTNDNVFSVIMGDMNESKTETGKGHIYDQIVDPHTQLNDMTLMLSPIAHKLIAACPGNHEEQIFQRSGMDVMDIMCKRLEIPYFRGAGMFHVLWKKRQWGFKIFHGKGNSQTKGGKMNNAIRSKRWTDDMDFFLSGHTHDLVVQPETKFLPDVPNCRIIEKTYWTVVAPSFLGYWGGYAQKMDYPPPAKGGVACVLYPDGSYKAEMTT